jgi:hypothetical protein
MTRLAALWLAGCVTCVGLILSNDSPSFEARLPPAKTEPAVQEIRKLAAPLSSPIQPRPEVPSADDDAKSPLRDVRLTGVVTGPDLRVAIFASGTDSLVLSEGETLKGWRIDRISPGKVLLSGPAGTVRLEPKPDANLVHRSTPVAVRPRELEPSVPPGAEFAGVPREPTATTPIPAGNLSAAIPVQAQVYPYYFPQNDAGYGQNYPSYDYYPYLYPSFAFVAPIGSTFRFGFFHRHDFHHGDFRNAAIPFRGADSPFHSAAIPFHGGGHR